MHIEHGVVVLRNIHCVLEQIRNVQVEMLLIIVVKQTHKKYKKDRQCSTVHSLSILKTNVKINTEHIRIFST